MTYTLPVVTVKKGFIAVLPANSHTVLSRPLFSVKLLTSNEITTKNSMTVHNTF